ncbi:putative baseplate assembly protein, partial [Pleurocapsales cyanobacterium LEGE 10410]|nr:putative baseplate assembly protein [Pleurocapsales cyanobacterium LEGE 10410]
DRMLMRFNQVPRRNYITFLEMLGMRLQPPSPAQTKLTFYLVSDLPHSYTIPRGIEVATQQGSNRPAVIFSTDEPLIIGQPQIDRLLSAETAEVNPQVLRDRLTNFWTLEAGEWSGSELALFDERPQAGNCVYLVLNPEAALSGNAIALTVKGQEATPTGINPDRPPRSWQAWNGSEWQPILLTELDDGTEGFSFSQLTRQGGNPLQGADIVLHLPLNFPITQFGNYRGRWLRCVCHGSESPEDSTYLRSPKITGIKVRSLGGTVTASQSEVIEDEVVGISNGNPGQTFSLQAKPVLARREDEYLIVTPPGELSQTWQEVADFADSQSSDRHYVIDSLSGTIQFGPLIREPNRLKTATEERIQYQTYGQQPRMLSADNLEQQYGAIPPKGATIRMSRYRTGGGKQGNVLAGTLKILKSAVPYVAKVTNHVPARNGADAETLEQLTLRVPQVLRTRDRAVTPEDFEVLTLAGGQGAVARAHCLPTDPKKPGTVELLVVPQIDTGEIEHGRGIHPDLLRLNDGLKDRIDSYLATRKLLGVNVECREPNYVGVMVQTEVALEAQYQNATARAEILWQLQVALYRFLNPVTGGIDGQGWKLGQPLYPSDVVALCQTIPGIRYLGAIQLIEMRRLDGEWVRLPPATSINPGIWGLICSWQDSDSHFGHSIDVVG